MASYVSRPTCNKDMLRCRHLFSWWCAIFRILVSVRIIWSRISCLQSIHTSCSVATQQNLTCMALFSEPPPRWACFSAAVETKLYIWGGCTSVSEPASSIHCFDPLSESWVEEKCSGLPPPTLSLGACAAAGQYLYVYGGSNGSRYQSSLFQLDTKSLAWKRLSSAGPTRKVGCTMVVYGNKLVLFGGYGFPCGPTQPGAEFIKSGTNADRGWTNELHTFDLKKGI